MTVETPGWHMLTNYADGPSAPMTCVCLGNGWVWLAGVTLYLFADWRQKAGDGDRIT